MKIRLDFVTNSSSSSFVCECCGNVEGGFDVCMTEVGMCQCENEHTLCDSHVEHIDFNSRRELLLKAMYDNIKYYDNRTDDYGIKEFVKTTNDIEFAKSITEEMYDDDYISEEKFRQLISDYDVDDIVPASKCPICTHKYISDSEMLDHALEKLNMNKKEFENIVRQYLIEKDKDL